MGDRINNIMDILSTEFEDLVKLFNTEDWKFYKFGQGGPYKRNLTKIQKLASDYDKEIIDRFGLSKEIATFRQLIVLAIAATKNAKETHENIDTFRRRIKWMRKAL